MYIPFPPRCVRGRWHPPVLGTCMSWPCQILSPRVSASQTAVLGYLVCALTEKSWHVLAAYETASGSLRSASKQRCLSGRQTSQVQLALFLGGNTLTIYTCKFLGPAPFCCVNTNLHPDHSLSKSHWSNRSSFFRQTDPKPSTRTLAFECRCLDL